MSIFRSVQLILYFFPVLIVGFIFRSPSAVKRCLTIGCSSYKTNETSCALLGYIGDPITRECKPQCTGPCTLGKCEFCFCQLPEEIVPTEKLIDCLYIYNIANIYKMYYVRSINYCNEDFFISPYYSGECVRRCTQHSCKNGVCSSQGTCVCDLGYRPDPLNPRTCTEIPTNFPNPQQLGCGDGEDSDINGDCVSSCTKQCKNGTCDANNACQCGEGYEFDNTTSSCEMQPDDTTDDAPNTGRMGIMPNMSITDEEKMVADDLYLPILASVIAILLVIVIVLVFIIIKQKQEIPKGFNTHEQQNEEVYSPNYYSALSFEKKPDAGVVVENLELYGKS